MTELPLNQLISNTGQIPDVPSNPRFIRDQRFNKLKQSIKDDPEFLKIRRLIVVPYQNKNIVVAGNMRLRACQELGFKTVPVDIIPEGTDPYLIRSRIIRDNLAFGEDDIDMLANEWDQLELEEFGYELDELKLDEEEVVEDEPPEVSSEPAKSKLGEIYILGKHRVMCGDSTDQTTVERLMAGKKADMVFTDPPYGIDIGNQSQGKGGGVAKKNNYGVNDWDKSIPYKAIELCLTLAPIILIWGGNYFADRLPASSCWIVWDKDNGSTDFADVELAWTNSKTASRIIKHKWAGMLQEDMSNKEERVHPTQKPTALATFSFNQFKAGRNILDLFLGSGSTLIACEQTDRQCYGLELDPKYVDVIRKRYVKFVYGTEENWEHLTPAEGDNNGD